MDRCYLFYVQKTNKQKNKNQKTKNKNKKNPQQQQQQNKQTNKLGHNNEILTRLCLGLAEGLLEPSSKSSSKECLACRGLCLMGIWTSSSQLLSSPLSPLASAANNERTASYKANG